MQQLAGMVDDQNTLALPVLIIADNYLIRVHITQIDFFATLARYPRCQYHVALRQMLQSRLHSTVSIHTTRVRILAESQALPAEQSGNILYLNIANGVGCTAIVDGRLLHGANNRSGEIGHMVVEPAGPLCGCGHHGCLEAMISGPALAKKIRADMPKYPDSLLCQWVTSHDMPEKTICHWARTLRQFFEYLAAAIKKRITSDVYDNLTRTIDIIPARSGDQALVRGVAIAILQHSLKI